MPWQTPIADTMRGLLAWRGRPAVVLASGDPLWFGVGTMILRHVARDEVQIVPAVSAFGLAAARLGWALQDVACLSCCGRPVEAIVPFLQDGARLLVLSADASTPAAIEALLAGTWLQRLGNLGTGVAGRRRRAGPARRGGGPGTSEPGGHRGAGRRPATRSRPRRRAFRARRTDHQARGAGHDDRGPGTAPRGVALGCRLRFRLGRHRVDAAASVVPGYWGGAPCGTGRAGTAERAEPRCARPCGAGGRGPRRLVGIGAAGRRVPGRRGANGGRDRGGVGGAAPRGRLVANAIALASEAALMEAHARMGGSLTRVGVERLDVVGGMPAFRPAMTVTQWRVVK